MQPRHAGAHGLLLYHRERLKDEANSRKNRSDNTIPVPFSVVLSVLEDEKQEAKSNQSERNNRSEATLAGEDLSGLWATVHMA